MRLRFADYLEKLKEFQTPTERITLWVFESGRERHYGEAPPTVFIDVEVEDLDDPDNNEMYSVYVTHNTDGLPVQKWEKAWGYGPGDATSSPRWGPVDRYAVSEALPPEVFEYAEKQAQLRQWLGTDET